MAYKVVDAEQLDADLTTVADAIRSETGGTEPLSFPDGMAAEVSAVRGAGEKAAYDAFWDAFQDGGSRGNYNCGFGGQGWTADNLLPKYSVDATNAYMMFAYCGYDGDLDDVFKNRGLTLEFHLNPDAQQGYMFFNARIAAVGTVDLSHLTAASSVASMFNSQYLTTIRSLIPPPIGMAAACWGNALENLGIGGEITADMTLTKCVKLTHDSIGSVIGALSDGVSGQTVTFSRTAVNNAFETSEGAADGSASEEWLALVATKSNWTISLV